MSKQLLQLLRDNLQRTDSSLRSEAAAGDAPATIWLYDVIDQYFGVSSTDFIAELDKYAGQEVELHINSPGGDVFEARAMATAIAKHGNVHAKIDALAASAATYVALACKTVEGVEGGFFMIHLAWTFAYGNKDDLTKTAGLLDKVDGTIIADYAKKTGATVQQLATWMAEETWFTSEEALAAGFLDSVFSPPAKDKKAAPANRGSWNVSAYAKAPKALLEQPAPPPPAIDDAAIAAQRVANQNRLRLLELT